MSPTSAIIDLLKEALGRHLDYPASDLDLHTAFHRYGLDSVGATKLAAELTTLGFRRPCTPIVFWQYPTLAELALYLAGEPVATPPQSVDAGGAAGHAAEPIAVIGMACRFPGAPDLRAFWTLLREGVDAISERARARWGGITGTDLSPGEAAVLQHGGWIEDIDRFDARFFGISPREAAYMDPQQRFMLELSWGALEDAGIPPLGLKGTPTGVFTGAIWADYETLLRRAGPAGRNAHTSSGLHRSILANRVSYVLGLQGPSLAIDTACSSGLVAVAMACESLRRGETTLALAGAVNLNLLPESTIEVAKFGALSQSGRCFTFDARADGYVRGEGAGVVVLKPLSRAEADGDRIYCVIRGGAVNNDGASNGLTAPNPQAQEAVLRRAYTQAGVTPRDVQYVEAHGTGTQLGDPIEARALSAVLCEGRPADAPLRIGSVKTNIGHLEGAAGIAGFIKAALSLHHRAIPASLHFAEPNPNIAFDSLRLEVQRSTGAFPDAERRLMAGVSAFGFGGTNAHVVLQEAEPSRAELVVCAGSSPDALRDQVLAVAQDLNRTADRASLEAIARGSARREPSGRHRFATVAHSRAELRQKLEAFLRGDQSPDLLHSGPGDTRGAAGPVFVFSGQGKQRPGMGQELLETEPVFRDAIERCDASVRRLLGWSVVDELRAPPAASRLEDVGVVLPCIIALEIGLVALWRSWGIRPGAVVGYSFGEIAAAHAAGVLDLEDTMLVACHEARLVQRTRGTGAMAVVGMSWSDTREVIAAHAGRVFAAIDAGAASTVIAGEPAALEPVLSELSHQGVFCRRIDMDVAPHSPLVHALGEEFLAALSTIRPQRGSIPFMSTLTASWLEPGECGPTHWLRNFVEPVRFGPAISRLGELGFDSFLEIGPHPLVRRDIASTLARAGLAATTLGSLREGVRDRDAMLEALGALFVRGHGGPERSPCALPIVLSARTEVALRAQAERLRGHLAAHPRLELIDLAYSLATTRTHFDHRAAIVARDRLELMADLEDLARGQPSPRSTLGQRAAPGERVFVFPGQGAQWLGMARSLLETSRVFRDHLEACDRALSEHLGRSLLAVLRGDEGEAWLDRVEVVQPALFAVMVSLAALWRSLGVEPDAVVGHSQGEIAAACVAGALSLEDAAKIVALRSLALTRLAGQGAMAAVELGVHELEARMARFGERLSIAAVNSPGATVISGAPEAVDALLEELAAANVFGRRVRVDYASHCAQIEAVRAELLDGLTSITPRATRIAMYSTVTGGRIAGSELDAAYWYRNLRHSVRFADATASLLAEGYRYFVEVSPHPLLTLSLRDTAERAAVPVTIVGSLRRDEGDLARVLRSLGELHVRGCRIDWHAAFRPLRPGRVELPGYAFERERHWLEAPRTRIADLASAGLSSAEHPLLGAAVALADTGGYLFTSRLSLADHAWLAAHAVCGVAILPGTAFVELAALAAHRLGLALVEELTLEAPLPLPADGAVEMQVAIGAPDEAGRRSLTVHARPHAAAEDAPWIRHASGVLSPGSDASAFDLRSWPPPGAIAVPIDGIYERLAELGYGYGPDFQGLHAVWKRGDELFAEVQLSEALVDEASRFALHPALLDGALHALLVEDGTGDIVLPISWTGVSLCATGATMLRARIERRAGPRAASLQLADASGEPVARVETLAMRPVSAEQLRALAVPRDALLRVDWTELAGAISPAPPRPGSWALLGRDRLEFEAPAGISLAHYADLDALDAALAQGAARPDVVVVVCTSPPSSGRALAASASSVIAAVHKATASALALVQRWLVDERLASSRLVVATRRAVATHDGEDVADLEHAALWGLLRSAQAEHPDRSILLLDTDDSAGSRRWLAAAIASAFDAHEAQLGLRAGRRVVPRLAPLAARPEPATARALDPEGTVLITGGTGTLGALVARHLVRRHRIAHLLLISRRGLAAPGAEALARELEADGARVTIAACDAADRPALEALLASVAREHPLTAVVHAAGTLDDGVLGALTPERVHAVLRAKIDAALHLHAVTATMDLAAFVMFSSLSGVLGGAGQANYAAANAFLDALAHHRKAQGLPALALAWGYWAQKTGMTAHLSDADLRRMARGGLRPLSSEDGLALLDAALARSDAALVAARFDARGVRARADAMPGMLRGLVRGRPARRAAASTAGTPALAQRLAALSSTERERALFELVAGEATAVLGLGSPSDLEPDRPLKELGLDSLMALELRNRLASATGMRLAPTTVFDHPTAHALAGFLAAHGAGRDVEPPTSKADQPVDDHDPIAIVAMGCRYPGGVRTPEELWQLVRDGRDAISRFPDTRGWDLDALYDPDADAPGKCYAREGGFLYDEDHFEPSFFGISPREALAIDPQQRLLLETSWEAIERAGIDPASLHGSHTGVFVGIMYNDYAQRGTPDDLEGYVGIGSAASLASGRIAYTFGLEGPAISVDTACSSSLVAIHLACQALRQGECSLALAGGVTVMATPGVFITFSRQRGLARDGRCKSFSAQADGAGWAEGVGMLLLERLSDARRNGHPVLAVLRGSAVNQDGRSQGLTAPNGPAQERVIRQALRAARLSPRDIDAVEAHGTGTSLGDPIEARALLATYGQRDPQAPLWLGSIKSNLGHTQAAAGVAGVIKMVLALQRGVLPRTLHADDPSPHIDWSSGTVQLLTEPRPWPSGSRVRRAAVSSFGISGTNAHLILEEAPEAHPEPQPAQPRTAEVFVLSARSATALNAMAGALDEHLSAHPEQNLTDIAHSLATTRSQMPHRLAVTASSHHELRRVLASAARGDTPPEAVRGKAGTARRKLAFLFTGQGSQRARMGQELHRDWPVFREAFDACTARFDRDLERPLQEIMWAAPVNGDGALLDQTVYTQPALFALEYALAQQWRAWGVEPDVVVGHSIGELVAACVAGVFSLDDATRLVAARARLMQSLPPGGAMTYIGAPEAEVEEALRSHAEVSIAAVNGPSHIVISGEAALVRRIAEGFAARGVRTKALTVSHAFHSALMAPMLEEFRRVADTVTYHLPGIAMVAGAHGALGGEQLATPEYWVDQVRRAVRFGDAIGALHEAGVDTFLEIGPRAALAGSVAECVPAATQPLVVSSLHGARPEAAAILDALAALWVAGRAVSWASVFPSPTRRVQLPTYPWQRQRYAIVPSRDGDPRRAPAMAVLPRAPDTALDMALSQSVALSLRRAGDRERQGIAERYITHELARVLGLEPSRIERDAPLAGLGIDSVTALILRNRVMSDLGVSLPADLIWKYEHVSALAGHLVEAWLLQAATSAPRALDSPQEATSDLDYEQEAL